MNDILQMVGLLAVVFGISMGLSYAVSARNRKHIQLVPIPENTSCRVIGPGGVYRCYFLRRSKKGLVFSAPLQRDSYVPVRLGEVMMVQAPMADSIVTFRAAVCARDADTHEFTVDNPDRIRHINRRAEDRDTSLEGTIVNVNGTPAALVDLSACGAKVVVADVVRPGDSVCLDLPEDYGVAHGWALESTPTADGRRLARCVRIRFEQPLSGLQSKRRRHMYLGD